MTEPKLEVIDTSHLVRELSAEDQAIVTTAAQKRARGEELTETEASKLAEWERPFPVEIRKGED